MAHFRRNLSAIAFMTAALMGSGLHPALGQHVVEDEPLSPTEARDAFHLPTDFEIQLVASEPQISKPINLNFDSRGRLLVTQSVEYPFPAEGPGRDAVMRLSINPETGRAETVETLVDGLNIPIGVTPIPHGVIVFSVPNIYRCLDTTGDDKIDHREVLLGPFGMDDTHGLNNAFTRGLDGWIYACHGFRNTSEVSARDGSHVKMTSGNTYRFRADGSRIEQFTQGQVNPFGLCFDPLANSYTADCHSKPAYQLLRGACYPSFGRPHDGLGFGPEIMQHNHGSTGIAGIAYYDAAHFPQKYRDRLFIGNPITGRINQDAFERHGSTYEAVEQPDFLRCDDKWFRPVDIQLGPDGALYVADFYNRIIGHYEVPLSHPGRDRRRGRIWRIVYRGPDADAPHFPDLMAADLAELLRQLDSRNLTVRTLATHELVDRFGEEAIPDIKAFVRDGSSAALAKSHGLWVLERLGALDSGLAAKLAANPDRVVRVHLIKALGGRAAWQKATLSIVRNSLTDDDPFVRRAAAEALGRHPDEQNMRPLLELWAKTPPEDTHLVHVVRMALRDHLLVPEIFNYLKQASFETGEVMRVRSCALGARTPAAADFVLRRLGVGEIRPDDLATNLHFAVRYGSDDSLAEALAAANGFESAAPVVQASVLTALHQALAERGRPLPETFQAWTMRLVRESLDGTERESVERGLELARQTRVPGLFDPVAAVALGEQKEIEPLRPLALDACVDLDAPLAVHVAEKIAANAQESTALRQKAAAALGRINSEEARVGLLRVLIIAPEPLAVTIAGQLAGSRRGGEQLFAAIETGKASPRLLIDRHVVDALRRAQAPDADEKISRLTAALPMQDDRLRQLVDARRSRYSMAVKDIALGEKVFVKTCAACHKIGNQGKKLGPELDGIGNRGLDRVLEDVLDPSRIVDGAFRTTVLVTRDGRTISGLKLRQEGQVIVMADDEGKEIRVPAGEVEEQSISPLSPMPANVAEIVKEADFYHLTAYLLAQRQASK